MFDARENFVDYFKKGIFPFKGNVLKPKEENSEEKSEEESINDGIIFIKEKSRNINNDLFKKYFYISAPIDLAKNVIQNKR